MAPEGFEDSSSASIEKAVGHFLELLYAGIEVPEEPVTDLIPMLAQRNREIGERNHAGERATDLAEEYGTSLQRVYVLIRRWKRQQ